MSNPSPLSTRLQKLGRISLRLQLMLALNGVVVLFLAGLILWDYATSWRALVREKRGDLIAEAESMLPSILMDRAKPADVQQYIDEVCSRMQATMFPGHHIAVDLGGQVLQARTHGRQSDVAYTIMRSGAREPDGIVGTEHGPIAVGYATRDGVWVFVSEHMANIQRAFRAALAERVVVILGIGLALAIIVNILVERLITVPLGALIDAARRVSQGDLAARVTLRVPGEIGFLADEFNAMSAFLEKDDAERRIEMKKAQRIQQNLAPRVGVLPRLSVAHIYQPVSAVAGDYFDIKRINDGATLFAVGDVAGHGIPAALGAAMLKTLFDSVVQEFSEPDRILAAINKGFAAVSLEEDFATMAVAGVDVASGKLRYASAGHEPGYLLRANGEMHVLDSTGPVLGLEEPSEWQKLAFDIGPGDRLFMLTDGITEARSESGAALGRERLRAVLEQGRSKPLDAVRQEILDLLSEFHKAAPQSDDVTLLAVEVLKA